MSAFSTILHSMSKSEHKALLKKLFIISMNRTKNNINPVGDHDLSNDIVSQTLIKGLEKQDQFSGDNICKWLVTILKTTHIDITRKGTFQVQETYTDFNNKIKDEPKKTRIKREHRVLDDIAEPSLEGDQMMSLYERDASECLGRLSTLENDIIRFRQQDYDYNQISLDLEITSANARVTLLRAKEKYMECMEGTA